MILDSFILQTKLLLHEDMHLEIIDVETKKADYEVLILKEFTSMIGVGGKINLITVISFDSELLNKLVSIFLDDDEVDESEISEIRYSVTGEVINTIMGLGITITPPVIINEVSILKKYINSKIVSANITTNFGTVSISAIGEANFIN